MMFIRYHKSIPYLEKAVKGINPDSKTNSFKERRLRPRLSITWEMLTGPITG